MFSRPHGGLPRLRSTQHITVVLAMTLALAVLGSTVGVADAQTVDRARVDSARVDRAVRTDVPRPVRDVETLRLACAPSLVGDQRGVLCEWSQAVNPNTRAYQLYRIVDGSPRELLTTVGADGRRAYFDSDLTAPSTAIYGVISLNRQGRLIGRSEAVQVQYGDGVEELRMACAAESINGERGVLCRWSEPQTERVRGYLVYRLVDRDARQLIARVPAQGRQAHFDTRVIPGALHTYGVTAVDGAGNVVAVGGPQHVQWPAAD